MNYSMQLQRSKLEKLIKKRHEAERIEKEESMLTSPTSLSMKNSFLIKTVGKTFDSYFTKKHKKKIDVRNNQ